MKRIVGVVLVALQLAGCAPIAEVVTHVMPYTKGRLLVRKCTLGSALWIDREEECHYSIVDPITELPREAKRDLRWQQQQQDADDGEE